MLKAGFITPLTIFLSNSFDRNDLYHLFQNLNQFILSKNIADGSLIYDRLYKRYVRFEDIDKTNLLMRTIEKDFLDLNKSDNFQYKKFFMFFISVLTK